MPSSTPSAVPAAANLDGKVFEVFFDGECPLCMREIRMLKRLDRDDKVRFTDIAAEGFDPASVGLTYESLMERIRGRMPDGSLVEGVEVFRQLYGAVGFGPVVAVSRLPVVSGLLDVGYRIFAKNRLKLTGRCLKDASGACTLPEPGA